MAIKPIDMQTNISQMIEVGRGEQARSDSVVGQQHVLEKESGEKSRLANTTMDETKKSGNATIQDQQKKEKKRGREKDRHGNGQNAAPKNEKRVDDRMGNIIDILK